MNSYLLCCALCGMPYAFAGQITETRLGLADTQCISVRLFAVAPNARDFAYAGLRSVAGDGRQATGDMMRSGVPENGWAVWSDGRLSARADSIVLFEFASSGQLLVGGTRAGKEFVSLEDAEYQYDRINWRSVMCSPDGSTLTFAAARNHKWLVVTNGVEGREYDGVGLPFTAADGKTVGYTAFSGERFGKAKWFVVIGGKEGKQNDGEFLGWVKPGSSGTRFACVEAQKGKAWVVENERAGTKYDDIGWLEYVPGTNRLYYAAKAHGKWFIVKEGYPLRERYDDISYVGFSPDGRRMAFVGTQGEKQFCVVDGNRCRSWDEVILPQFSPDNKRFGYLARRNDKWSAVIGERDGRFYDGVSWLTWNGTTSDFAYRARLGNRYCIVVNGAESELYDDIERLWWSSEGRALLAAARQGKELLLLRADVKK